jgi:phosphopantothenoylcysteine decarboxylase/phosphopantothenate--cysteine ligase
VRLGIFCNFIDAHPWLPFFNAFTDRTIAQENVGKLKKNGYKFICPEPGWLACRNVGAGRLTEPAEIVDEVVLNSKQTDSSNDSQG